jgi:hypothetical protein
MTDTIESVGTLLDALERRRENERKVSIGWLFDQLGDRTYGPALLLPALIEISPIGGMPGVPTFLAGLIILFSVQILMGQRHLWLPGFVQRRRISHDRLMQASRALRPVARRLDNWFHGRLEWFTQSGWDRVVALICILFALTVPPLEFIPFASTIPMGAIALFGLSLLLRDGALVLAGLTLAIAGIAAGSYFLMS